MKGKHYKRNFDPSVRFDNATPVQTVDFGYPSVDPAGAKQVDVASCEPRDMPRGERDADLKKRVTARAFSNRHLSHHGACREARKRQRQPV